MAKRRFLGKSELEGLPSEPKVAVKARRMATSHARVERRKRLMAMSRLTVAAKRVVPGPPGGSPGSEMSEDASLVAAAANGDAAAFRSLVDRHLSGVLA